MRESERERAKLERESAHVNERERERESADRTAAAPRRERFRGRACVLCFVLARAPHAVGRGTVRCRGGEPPLGRRRARARVGRSRVACVGMCAVPARARWGRRDQAHSRVGAYVAGFRKGAAAAGIRGGGSRVGGRMLDGR